MHDYPLPPKAEVKLRPWPCTLDLSQRGRREGGEGRREGRAGERTGWGWMSAIYWSPNDSKGVLWAKGGSGKKSMARVEEVEVMRPLAERA